MKITKNEWVAMFEEIGLTDQQMDQWHRLFEQRHPEAHQSFLEGLGLRRDEVEQLRQSFA